MNAMFTPSGIFQEADYLFCIFKQSTVFYHSVLCKWGLRICKKAEVIQHQFDPF
jgi:hypothetical protein